MSNLTSNFDVRPANESDLKVYSEDIEALFAPTDNTNIAVNWKSWKDKWYYDNTKSQFVVIWKK